MPASVIKNSEESSCINRRFSSNVWPKFHVTVKLQSHCWLCLVGQGHVCPKKLKKSNCKYEIALGKKSVTCVAS